MYIFCHAHDKRWWAVVANYCNAKFWFGWKPCVLHKWFFLGCTILHSDKTKGNAKGSARRLLAALNLEHAMNITAFPTDFLESGECLFDLFELWIEQEDKTYHSEQEKMRRFKIFRDMVFRVKELSKIQKSYTHGLTCFADLIPEEIRSNGYINVNFRNLCWRAIYRLNWDVGFLQCTKLLW